MKIACVAVFATVAITAPINTATAAAIGALGATLISVPALAMAAGNTHYRLNRPSQTESFNPKPGTVVDSPFIPPQYPAGVNPGFNGFNPNIGAPIANPIPIPIN